MTASMYGLQRAVVSLMDTPAARVADFTGTAFDTVDYEGDCLIQQITSAVSGTPSLVGKLTECDTIGGTYTDVANSAFTAVTTADHVQAKSFRVGELKRYIKWAGTVTGGTPSVTAGAYFIGLKKYQ